MFRFKEERINRRIGAMAQEAQDAAAVARTPADEAFCHGMSSGVLDVWLLPEDGEVRLAKRLEVVEPHVADDFAWGYKKGRERGQQTIDSGGRS